MAIDLPPVIPPAAASADAVIEARRNESGVQATIDGVAVKVYGNQYLSDSDLVAVLESAATPAEAVIKLAKRYYEDGHLLVSVNYARLLDSIAIIVHQKSLNQVVGAEELSSYFKGLEGDSDLKMSEFHRAKVLADLRSRRAGYNYEISYTEQGLNAVDMVLTRTAVENHKATEFIVEANNKGSRFLGRYFGLAGVKHKTESGTQISASYQTAFTDLGESRDGEELNQVSVSVDHPFAQGLYGIDLNYVDYLREPTISATSPASCPLGGTPLSFLSDPLFALFGQCTPSTTSLVGVELDAEIIQATLRGEQVLYSTPWKQFSLTQRVEFVDSTIERKDTGEMILDENYQVLELGARYSQNRYQSADTNASRFATNLRLRGGLGDDSGTLGRNGSARTAEFIALLPSASYEQRIADGLTFKANARGQLSDSQLPQQQQFVLGGMDTLSAYLPGVLIGDEGYHLSMALDKAIGELAGIRITPSVFAEMGASRYQDASGELGDMQSLADAGLRVKFEYGKWLYSEVVAAAPVYDDVADEDFIERLEADFYWRLRMTF
ncbi:ShlB/FhaC/HecB family hemolysin secretion/activation protein [Spongiibacter tropicus]|uniref:ShlB/FhaC/HecB family hemolysin secretion/activation protein n=1 Tax=Spongiibacter tropicus TaxID=454602 RepID=UPI0003B39B2B|nr:ShlB/FhaC/HecB family hemolysin secretion/activation protein [Spongiibacter tropicus]